MDCPEVRRCQKCDERKGPSDFDLDEWEKAGRKGGSKGYCIKCWAWAHHATCLGCKTELPRTKFSKEAFKTAWKLSRESHTREDVEQHSNIGTGSAIDVPLAAAEP